MCRDQSSQVKSSSSTAAAAIAGVVTGAALAVPLKLELAAIGWDLADLAAYDETNKAALRMGSSILGRGRR